MRRARALSILAGAIGRSILAMPRCRALWRVTALAVAALTEVLEVLDGSRFRLLRSNTERLCRPGAGWRDMDPITGGVATCH